MPVAASSCCGHPHPLAACVLSETSRERFAGMASRDRPVPEPEEKSKSLGRKLKGIFSSKAGDKQQETAGSQQGASHRPAPGPYFASQPPQRQWTGPSPVPGPVPNVPPRQWTVGPAAGLPPARFSPPMPNHAPYASPPPPPPLPGTRLGQYGGAPAEPLHSPYPQQSRGVGGQSPQARLNNHQSTIPNDPGRRSPLPPEQPPYRVHTPNTQIPPPYGTPPPVPPFTTTIRHARSQGSGRDCIL
ncbi:hypothetical protein QBC34DRAFT_213705 [Podospora aff. communis PSN243]|uniref:Uncharacterized protein n=1 Tax=Podospora aff. communis PSN243 TaxID=3040156 RepID=A0AAV9G260_9PEZI|nr:hypothetical protein QBC34DRAFT_213705 [Podospora aff. communis PSN243]